MVAEITEGRKTLVAYQLRVRKVAENFLETNPRYNMGRVVGTDRATEALQQSSTIRQLRERCRMVQI